MSVCIAWFFCLVLPVYALPVKFPATFQYIDWSYTGNRFENKTVLLFGGTSGMGFASAAMFIQECSRRTVLAARNAKQGTLAAEVLQNISQGHCAHQGTVEYQRADIRKREEIRKVLSSFNQGLDVIVNSAAIPGYFGDLGDIPDVEILGPHDGLFNDIYGAMFVSAEALQYWQRNPSRSGSQPSLIHFSSEQGMTPCRVSAVYSMSKHAIIGLTTSVAEAHKGQIRANVVLPGLVQTPFTWNQARLYVLLPNGTLVLRPNMQMYQCVKDGEMIDGDCPDGGRGYGCPCPDLIPEDPRLKVMFPNYPASAADPRLIAATVLKIADPTSSATGKSFIVDVDGQWECDELTDMWQTCPKSRTTSVVDAFLS